MWVKKLDEPREGDRQCVVHKSQLRDIGWKGYREKRAAQNGKDPNQCMRVAAWNVDGKYMCTQHGGLYLLEKLSKENG